MPWRRSITPYRVLISEVMLQQTQVDRVIPKFNAWMKEFPDFESLVKAPLSSVLKAWNGLGYNRRAINLHRLAKMIAGGGVDAINPYTRNAGNLSKRAHNVRGNHTVGIDSINPRDNKRRANGIGSTNPYDRTSTVADWDSLPGIGPATAAAICVYAFNQPHAFIETNVRAVFIHHFFSLPPLTKGRLGGVRRPMRMRAPPDVACVQTAANPLSLLLRKGEEPITDTDILPLVQQTLDTRNPREWYWALMDYGTYLKKQYKNPSRRSKHYTKQSKFEGSNRQLRGKIVKLMVASGGTGKKFSAPTIGGLAKQLNLPKQKVAPVMAQLVKDGFITMRRGKFSIA